MAELLDHITDDGYTTLCGLRDDELPPAPLCPRCQQVERATGRTGLEMSATRFASRQEPVARR